MSSTRHANPGAPLSQERYMSSPEYAEIRGIAGNAVVAKAALMGHPAKRSLLFFLQAMSLQPGGLQRFTREFMAMFADRIGTPTMHRVGMKPDQTYDWETTEAIRQELCKDQAKELLMQAMSGRPSEEEERATSLADEHLKECRSELANLPGFIIELCINPGLRFSVPGETKAALERERVTLEEEFEGENGCRTWDDAHYGNATLPYFQDIIGALFEFKRRYEEAARRDFITTEVARQVFEVLDVGQATGKMVVIQGESRIGKTTAAVAWCKQHLGEARFVSLSGILNHTGVFRAIAKAFGLASNASYTATKLQARVEDMLQRSRLVLVIDEAHFLLAPTERTRRAPELIDWVDTALCNQGVPCALVCTPQLTIRMARHEHQAGWNADQWRGRVKRFCILPEIPKAQDLRAVARKLLPGADKPLLDYIVGYALSSKLHMPAVVDAVDEVKLLVRREGREEITFEDVERVIRDYCAPSVAAMGQTFARAAGRKGRGKADAVISMGSRQPAEVSEASEAPERENTPDPAFSASGGKRLRFHDHIPALIADRESPVLSPA